MSRGRLPAVRHHPVQLAVLGDWVLFELQASASNGWRNVKLAYAGGERVPKANYSLGWNGERLAANHDAVVLWKHQRALHDALIAWLVENRHA